MFASNSLDKTNSQTTCISIPWNLNIPTIILRPITVNREQQIIEAVRSIKFSELIYP